MNTFKLFGNPDHWIGQRQLALRGYFHFAKYGLLSTDPEARAKAKLFLQFIPRYTMVGMPLLFWYHQLAGEVVKNSIPGDLVECGTWNGGSAAIMAAALQAKADTRNIRLFDSFRGLPEPTSEDGTLVNRHFFPEYCKGDADKVREAFNLIGYDERLIHIHEGWFEDSFPAVDFSRIALLHIDADWYEPVKLCLETWYEKVSPGGYILLNDYGVWDGCTTAVNEFLANRQIGARLQRPSGVGAWFRKPG